MKFFEFLNSKKLFITLIIIALILLYIIASLDKFHTLAYSIGYLVGSGLAFTIFIWLIPFWLLLLVFSFFTKKTSYLKWMTSNNGIMLGFIIILIYKFGLALEIKNQTNKDTEILTTIQTKQSKVTNDLKEMK